ncbi:hypothetical protein KE622_12625 [Shewanella algae]|uniref:hypothetical protein n=1 Tax=Shewanella algae TaxID=38313 RepID=UPI0013C36C75|nr:hypothetical protein [Shewanella algae]QXP18779.1 hypothetical protein KE621_17935 [Shewanella algae]QXP28340.1 hypothetical protein KE622_12625 [Shewanella algae]QXP34650.1 hypothetical protein KE623_02985 [Shewanella algae]QXP37534.1 hypothetical protein KE624_17505 [Shewanella algae]
MKNGNRRLSVNITYKRVMHETLVKHIIDSIVIMLFEIIKNYDAHSHLEVEEKDNQSEE